MDYAQLIRATGNDAARLEDVYQAAVKASSATGFANALEATYAEQPDNLLYAAWHYRLAAARAAITRHIPWVLALGLALLNGLVLWVLSDTDRLMLQVNGRNMLPVFLVVWAPVSALFVLAYLVRTGAAQLRLAVGLGIGLAALALYAIVLYPRLSSVAFQEQYLPLAMLHLPLLAWAAVGVAVLGGLGRAHDRFAFALKSLEVFVLAGLFACVLGVLTIVTVALFSALDINLGTIVPRLILAGGGGMIVVLAVAIAYDPGAAPAEQSFEGGLSKLLALLLRLFLPLTLLVLAVYVVLIPFNFWKPFENRDVLITYNVMLFAVMALLVAVTPLEAAGLPVEQQRWLRRGIVAVAALALIVGVYALAAILYRTAQEGFTPNRVTFIGWNVINAALLALLLNRQRLSDAESWLPSLQRVFGAAAVFYTAWSAFVVLALPWLF